ncbi:hypothetical protein [Nostoc sp.]|uniref:hypothetical protein n=1 Tax=Nostoc sp. TaxID=1180 RepID=UPI002FFCA49A
MEAIAVPDRDGGIRCTDCPKIFSRKEKAYPLMTKPQHELRKQLQTAYTTIMIDSQAVKNTLLCQR